MSIENATAAPSTSEAVLELIRQLTEQRFVLTDRDGAVTRWGAPAQELFGWTSSRMLGRPLAQAMDLPELPAGGGHLEATARRKDESELQLSLTLVPVAMSQSLEFNGFLEALEAAGPYGASLAQVEARHQAVVDSLAAAIEGRVELEGPAAGIIVAFEAPEPEAPALSALRVEVESLRGEVQETRALRAELAATRARLESLEDRQAEQEDSPREDPELDAQLARLAEAAELAERLIAESHVLRNTLEESLHGRGYEAPLALRPYDGNGASGDPATVDRAQRPGFDDAPHPLATFGLDGHFRELNRAFTELVGYPEEKFQAAVWPPVTDHENLEKHREQINELLEGTAETADFDTVYLHAQGLLVPVAGTISLVRDEEGAPERFLLSVEPVS